jgi:signal peptide peptidase SppA
MTLATLVNTMHCKPMLATEAGFKAFKSTFDAKALVDVGEMAVSNAPAYRKQNGIGVISFRGFVVNAASPLEEEFFGVVSLERFAKDLKAMMADEDVKQGVIFFDSPGGYTMGVYECAELVKQFAEEKPLYAYTSGLMCSAAYRLASQCSNVFASPSSYVGSVGVYCEYWDLTQAMKMQGVEVKTFQGGSKKTIGSPFISLTKEQEAEIQADIDKEWEAFKSAVRDARGGIKEEFLQGQALTGAEAMDMNTQLVDGLFNSIDDLVATIKEVGSKD